MRLTTKQLCIEAMTIMVLLYLVMLMGGMTGFLTSSAHFKDEIGLSFDANAEYNWTPQVAGELQSFRISGLTTLQPGGHVSVRLATSNATYLVYETSYSYQPPVLVEQQIDQQNASLDITGLFSTVGLVVGDALEDIGQALDNPPVDVSETEIVPEEQAEIPAVEQPEEIAENESVAENITELPVETPTEDIIVNETVQNATAPETIAENETAVNETIVNETQEESENATTEIPQNITESLPVEPVIENATANETQNITEPIPELVLPEQSEKFKKACVETCSLSEFDGNYTLLVEVVNATISIDELLYEIKAEKLVNGTAFAEDEDIYAEGEKIGKKVADDASFETFFTFIAVANETLELRFYHNSTDKQPIWIETMGEINYTLSADLAEQFEEVSLNVTLQSGKIPKFKLHVGSASEIFEFGITVITVQSYPTVGGNWTVEFNTTGTADLMITGYNGTAFGTDLEFLELTCGNTTLNATFNGTSAIYPNYACDEIGTETSRVITAGRHTLEFSFGDSVDYAHNIAGVNLSCVVRTDCESNETDVLHMSNTTDAHAEMPDGTDYSYKVCCNDTSGRNAISAESSGYDFLYLYAETDAHAEQRSLSNYANAAYIKANASNITCSYDSVSGVCTEGKTCLLTMSDSTDAHVADCTSDPYDITVCCNLESVGEPANYTTFNGATTDFNGVPDINNVSQPVLENTDYGKIVWSGSVNASGADFDSAITISTNLVRVNSSILHASFNSSATITLYGVAFTNPKPVWDPEDNGTFVNCPPDVCSEISYEGGNFTFSVTRFTGYSSDETPNTAPEQVTLFSPASGSSTVDLTPTLEWDNATDVDNDTLTYTLQVDDDSNFGSLAIDETGIAEASPRTSYTPVDELAVDTTYFWHVRAYDGQVYGDWSDTWNLTVQSSASVSLIISAVDFGTVNLSATYNTSGDSPQPFLVENDGNVAVNVTIYGTDFWQRFANPTSNYQFKCREYTSSCPNGSATDWTDMTNSTSPSTLVVNLPYTGGNQVKSDIKITVPSDEPAGVRSSTVYIIASQA